VDGEAIKAGGSRYNLATGPVVYGGIYGHGLYRKAGSSGLGNPIFTSPTNAQDGAGWTRHRPAIRTIQEGKALKVTFKLEVINPTSLFYSASNTLRIGLFRDSGGNFINTDDTSTVSSDFSPYTGYMIGIGLNHRILKRIPNSSTNLILSSGAFTQLTTTPMRFSVAQNPYLPPRNLWPILQVDLTIGKSEGMTYINSIVTGHAGNGDVTQGIQQIHTDTPDTLSFNTLVVGAPSNMMDAFKISDVKIIYT
jgi:hypothetical protein